MEYQRLGLHKPVARSRHGVAVTKHPLATDIAIDVFRDGGNAVDAAIAAAFAIGVVEPYMSGIGGVGLGLLYQSGLITVIDGGPVSPRDLDSAAYPLDTRTDTDDDLFGWPSVVGGANLRGATSVCVPSMVAMMEQRTRRVAALEPVGGPRRSVGARRVAC